LGFLSELRSAIKLERSFRELSDSFRETQDIVGHLESEVARLKLQSSEVNDFVERAVGRWSKRDQVDRKRAKDAEPAVTPQLELDQAIRDGRVSVGSYRDSG